MTPRSRTAQEMTDIQQEVKRLERDLNQALELNNRAIADRCVIFETVTRTIFLFGLQTYKIFYFLF